MIPIWNDIAAQAGPASPLGGSGRDGSQPALGGCDLPALGRGAICGPTTLARVHQAIGGGPPRLEVAVHDRRASDRQPEIDPLIGHASGEGRAGDPARDGARHVVVRRPAGTRRTRRRRPERRGPFRARRSGATGTQPGSAHRPRRGRNRSLTSLSRSMSQDRTYPALRPSRRVLTSSSQARRFGPPVRGSVRTRRGEEVALGGQLLAGTGLADEELRRVGQRTPDPLAEEREATRTRDRMTEGEGNPSRTRRAEGSAARRLRHRTRRDPAERPAPRSARRARRRRQGGRSGRRPAGLTSCAGRGPRRAPPPSCSIRITATSHERDRPAMVAMWRSVSRTVVGR